MPATLAGQLEVRDGLDVRGARRGALARAQPPHRCLSGLAGFLEVMRHQLRLPVGQLAELPQQALGHPRVIVLALALEHGRVGGLLHQRLLERELFARLRAAPMQQVTESRQQCQQLVLPLAAPRRAAVPR